MGLFNLKTKRFSFHLKLRPKQTYVPNMKKSRLIDATSMVLTQTVYKQTPESVLGVRTSYDLTLLVS